MIVEEIHSKTILSRSKVYEYTINPYTGCQHGCTYCYARFMKRFTGHKEKWGKFVDVKINALSLLKREIKKKKTGRVWISGVCDPYQPLEREYELTRDCLKILSGYDWPVNVQTKSPLVLRDLDLLRKFQDLQVVLTISTGDENIREKFERYSPKVEVRIKTLERLSYAGIETCAMIAPLLPGAEKLVSRLNDTVDRVIIDRMNYHYADWVYKKYDLEYALSDQFFTQKKKELNRAFKDERIPCQVIF